MKLRKKEVNIFLIMILGIVSLFLTSFLYVNEAKESKNEIVLNEICSNNFSVGKNEEGSYCDYVELYNPTLQDQTLDEYYLSDDKEFLCKFSLQGMRIPAKGYLVVWLDAITEENENNSLGISSEGESVYLVKGENEVIVDSVYVPRLIYNTCYARVEDGESRWDVAEPTLGITNTGAWILPAQELKEPQFSAESGFYEENFYLKIQAGVGEKIYYTLDGSKPTPESIKYTGKIEIHDCSKQDNLYAARKDLSPTRDYTPDFKVDKAMVVRAISYQEVVKRFPH